jgi:site-specific recombinase XerD
LRHLQSQPSSPQRHRIRVLLLLLKETGCRLQQWASLRREALWCNNGRWTLRLQNKNAKERVVALTDELSDALLENYRCQGFMDLSSVPPMTPLLTAVQGETKEGKQVKGLSGSRIYRIIKDFFCEVADAFEQSDVDLAVRLRRISADSFLYLD